MSLQEIRQSDPGPVAPAAGAPALDDLEQRILAAVAYRDVFRFPPTAGEIHRYLPGAVCAPADVQRALDNGRLVPGYLATDGEFFALRGREAHFAVRQKRRAAQVALRRRAGRFARLLATLPFVEMVAISGSLAADNADADADVDLFVVIRGGCLWRARLLILLVRRLDRTFGTRTFCPNSMRTTRSLAFEFERPYIAQELALLVPLHGYPVYQSLLAANPWYREFLPNADAAVLPEPCRPYASSLRRTLEWLLDSAPGARLESWWAERKLAQFGRAGHELNAYSAFDTEREGLNLAVADAIEAACRERLAALGVDYDRLVRRDAARS